MPVGELVLKHRWPVGLGEPSELACPLPLPPPAALGLKSGTAPGRVCSGAPGPPLPATRPHACGGRLLSASASCVWEGGRAPLPAGLSTDSRVRGHLQDRVGLSAVIPHVAHLSEPGGSSRTYWLFSEAFTPPPVQLLSRCAVLLICRNSL